MALQSGQSLFGGPARRPFAPIKARGTWPSLRQVGEFSVEGWPSARRSQRTVPLAPL